MMGEQLITHTNSKFVAIHTSGPPPPSHVMWGKKTFKSSAKGPSRPLAISLEHHILEQEQSSAKSLA